VIDDAAQRLGVDSGELSDALEGALADQIDQAVKDGRLTQAQAAEMKQRLADGDAPLVAVPGAGMRHEGHAFFGAGLDAAATYLGLTESALHEKLADGTTLAQVAKAQGKTVGGLVAAMVADATKHLADAVANGDLTQAQQADMLADLQDRVEDLVDNGFRGGHGPGGPPPGAPGGFGLGGPGAPPTAPDDQSSDSGTDA
jgi:hypothetical protein